MKDIQEIKERHNIIMKTALMFVVFSCVSVVGRRAYAIIHILAIAPEDRN
jgi:hypothetical protein